MTRNDYYIQIKNTEKLHPKHSIEKGIDAAIESWIYFVLVEGGVQREGQD